MTRDQFLQLVRAYVATDPESAAFVAEAARQGISAALHEATCRAADMEIALSVSLDKSNKKAAAIIHHKLTKWAGKTALDWPEQRRNVEDERR